MSIEKLSQTEIENRLEKYGFNKNDVVTALIQYELNSHNPDMTLFRICNDYLDVIESNTIKEYIWKTICREEWTSHIATQLEPVSEKKYSRAYYHSGKAHITEVFEGDCIYVESEFIGDYGKQFWVSSNNLNNTLFALPSRKNLIQKLEVGKFYKCTKFEEYRNRGYKYYEYEFEEIPEKEFLLSINGTMGAIH